MKKLVSMLAIAALVTSFVACDDDESTPDGPTITSPSVTNVQVEGTVDVTFDIDAPGGFKSYAVTAEGGTATKKSEPAAGASEGDVVVTYSANTTAGAGAVTIVVTDNNGKTETETAVINKTAEPVAEVVVVNGVIDENTSWTADKIYELAGRVIVKTGVTLTIAPGTIVKGREGQALNASALMIARGGKIEAVGTADQPIIFTSELDNIQPGQKNGSNLDETDRGLWGGLVILGKAPISVNGALEAQIEGVPASEVLGLYGGDLSNDDSGTLAFVSIRHGGTVIAEGSEINGLTLGGVGSETSINNIEIFGNVDDGVEFFGGSVNVSNLLVTYQGDDGIDIDQAYSGTVDGFYVIHGGDTDEGLEIDGPEGAANATGKFTLKNGTLKAVPLATGDASSIGDFKSNAQGTLMNVLITGYPAGKKIKIAKSFSAACGAGSSNAYEKLIGNDLTFTSVQFTGFGVDVYSANEPNCADATAEQQSAAEAKIVSAAATGAPALTTWAWTVTKAINIIE